MSANVASKVQSGVEKVLTSRCAAVAIKEDGSVVTWGQVDGRAPKSVKNVTKIVSSSKAFDSHKSGAVVTFGLSNQGGDSITVSSTIVWSQGDFLNGYAFVALKNDTGGRHGAESSGGPLPQ